MLLKYDPAATLIYSPVAISNPGADGILGGANAADDFVIADVAANGGALLPSIGILPDASACKLLECCLIYSLVELPLLQSWRCNFSIC